MNQQQQELLTYLRKWPFQFPQMNQSYKNPHSVGDGERRNEMKKQLFVIVVLLAIGLIVATPLLACRSATEQYHGLILVNQLPREISYELWWVNAPSMPTQVAYGHIAPEGTQLVYDQLFPGGRYELHGHYDDGELVLDTQINVPINISSDASSFVVIAS